MHAPQFALTADSHHFWHIWALMMVVVLVLLVRVQLSVMYSCGIHYIMVKINYLIYSWIFQVRKEKHVPSAPPNCQHAAAGKADREEYMNERNIYYSIILLFYYYASPVSVTQWCPKCAKCMRCMEQKVWGSEGGLNPRI